MEQPDEKILETRLAVLMPVFNDWESAGVLIEQLNVAFRDHPVTIDVFLVDDGSTLSSRALKLEEDLFRIRGCHVIELRKNVGHQRAICLGLTYLNEKTDFETIVIMDSDGEDSPEDIPRLLERFQQLNGQRVVFAERAKRSENLMFRCFYLLYRWLHWLLIGVKVRVGNFSVLDRMHANSLSVTADLWNHYAASVYGSRLPFDTVPTARAKRIDGQSQMSFLNLVVHGLSAIAVFSDRIGVRMLVAIGVLLLLNLCGFVVILVIRLGTDWAIPGWATFTSGLLAIGLLQLISLLLVFSFIVLNGRTQASFLPARDYEFFINRVIDLPNAHD